MTALNEQQVEALAKGLHLTEDFQRSWYEDDWTETRANMRTITILVNRALEQQRAEIERYVHSQVIPVLVACTDHPSQLVISDVISKLDEMTATTVKADGAQP